MEPPGSDSRSGCPRDLFIPRRSTISTAAAAPELPLPELSGAPGSRPLRCADRRRGGTGARAGHSPDRARGRPGCRGHHRPHHHEPDRDPGDVRPDRLLRLTGRVVPSAAPIISLICGTASQLQGLVPLVMALWLAAMLTIAMFLRGPLLTIGLIVTVVVALVILNLPAMLGALGVIVICGGA